MTGLELHMYDQLEQAKGYLEQAKANPGAFDARELERQAVHCLKLALGFAKRAGKGFAAGRILTAIQWAKRIGNS